MSENAQPKHKKKRKRSPGYPGIDLKAALEKARIIREKEGENWVPVPIATADWDYRPNSGPGMVAVAALKKFGLVEDEGSAKDRKIRLTDLARRIIIDDRTVSPDRDQAIREAALKPNIHAKLWNYYKGKLPSDETMRFWLKADEGFTDRAADDLISEFRKTIEFSKLDESDIMSLDDESQDGPEQGEAQTNQEIQHRDHAPMINKGGIKMINIPIPLTEATAVVAIPENMTPADWRKLDKVLEAYKPEEATDSDDGGQ